ncbi:MAG: elongation factor P [Bordetella sp.]|nr:MAG: elongation factor P [Bordetella sp.]
MKTAQELRFGNIILINKEPLVVQRTEYNKSGRNSAVVKLKFKNLFTNSASEFVFKADEKFEVINLEYKKCIYSYLSGSIYVFMDEEYNQHEILSNNIDSNTLNYLQEGMHVDLVLYNEFPISIQLPNTVIREIIYTEPAIRGDTSNKVLKSAKISENLEINVPLFCEIGDKIEVDTRTNEYKNRISD